MKKSQFAVTRELFTTYLGYVRPLSYAEWLDVADEQKAAVLYCQFYDQITLAWYKLVSPYSTEEDGVAEILQYLQKNVAKIVENPSRFTPAYIYRVAYNCLFCLCKDPNRYKAVFENEISNVTYGPNGDELDLFDTVPAYDSYEDNEYLANRIWYIINKEIQRRDAENPGSGKAFAIVVSELLGDLFDFTGKYHKFDFLIPGQEECKDYKKTEEITFGNLQTKKAAIRAKYGDNLKTDITEVVITRGGKELVRLEYVVNEARPYKGMQQFTAKERDSVSDETRADVIAYLKKVLAPYRAAFC